MQIPTSPLGNKKFLASQMSIDRESFQRTDISTQPLVHDPTKIFKANTTEPTNMIGSNPTDPTIVLDDFIIRAQLQKFGQCLQRDIFLHTFSLWIMQVLSMNSKGKSRTVWPNGLVYVFIDACVDRTVWLVDPTLYPVIFLCLLLNII